MKFHAELFDERGYVMVDRLYNWAETHRFQVPIRKMGFRAVYNFQDKYKGKFGAVGDFICVGGNIYVKWMPKHLVTAHKDFFAGLISRAELNAKLESRKELLCKEKGWPDKDGGQMFFYPDLTNVQCFDPDTDEPIESPRFKTKTFTLLPDSEAGMRIFKFLQHFQFESKEWFRWAGLRSHVEGNNQHMKDDAHADLGSPKKRRPRGYAFQALVVASTSVASNMRRIVTFLKGKLDAVVDKATQRARRRRDAHGNRLAHHPDTAVIRQ